MESWQCSLLNEKLWSNFFNHRHHQRWTGDSSTFPHSPNVGNPTTARDEVFSPSTDPLQPSESVFKLATKSPSLFQTIWQREEKWLSFGFHKVCYTVHGFCYIVSPTVLIHTYQHTDMQGAVVRSGEDEEGINGEQ